MALATLTVDLNASIAKFESDLTRAVRSSKQATDEIKGAFESMRNTLQTLGIGFGLTKFFDELIQKNLEFEQSQNQLQAALRATGGAAGQTTQDLEAMAAAFSQSTAFDTEDIRAAETELLRFRSIRGDFFREALQATLDLANAQGGKAKDAARDIGRALLEPGESMRLLKQFGVELNDQQKILIATFQESGDKVGAMRVILDAINASMGGGAEGANRGLVKATRDLNKAWSDLLVTFGQSAAVRGTLGGFFDFLSQGLKDLDEDIQRIRDAKGIKETLGEIAAALDPARALGTQQRPKELAEPVDQEQLARQRTERGIANAQAAAARQREAEQQRQRDQFQAIERRAALSSAALAKELQAEQAQLTQRQQLLDTYYARGLISTTDYYNARIGIIEEASRNEIAQVRKAIEAQQALLSRPELIGDRARRQQIEQNIQSLRQQEAQLEQGITRAQLENEEKRTDATQKLDDAVTQLNIDLLEQAGRYREAEQIRQQFENRALRQQLERNAPGNVAQLNQLERQKIAQAGLNELEEQATRIRNEEAIQEERIQNSRRVGAISELESLKQTDEARQKSVAQLREVAKQMEALAITPKQIDSVKQFQAAIDQLAASADLLGDKFRTTFSDALTSPLTEFILGTQSASDAFRNFVRNIERSLANLAAQNIAESIFGKGGVGSAAPNFLANIFGGVFGSSGGGGIADFFAKLFKSSGGGGSSIPIGLAAGGITKGPTIAGESGPEGVVPLSGGRFIPVDIIDEEKQKGQEVHINAPVTIVTQDAASFRRSEQQVGLSIGRSLQRAMARV